MGIIGKSLIFTLKVAGTAVAGTAGVASAILAEGASMASPEAGKAFGGLRDGCFSVAKQIWNPDATADDVLKDISKSTDQLKKDLKDAESALNALDRERKKELINNPDALRKALQVNGKNPKLADNPEFIKYLKEHWGI